VNASRNEPSLFLTVDGEEEPLADSLTLGRHLDNDILLSGEDVLDYHARISVTDRAVTLHPLLDATIVLNGSARDQPVGIVPGDELQIGASRLALGVRADGSATHWFLHRVDGDLTLDIAGKQLVGRDEDAALRLDDDHISRQHASLLLERHVWLADLGSANGTFVNGERVVGGVRLHHGDYVSFDTHRFQLIGSGPELTPIRTGRPDLSPIDSLEAPELRSDTTVIGVVDVDDASALASLSEKMLRAEPASAGAFFIGASEPVTGEFFRPGIGRSLFGRGAECDFQVADRTVSLQHAEVVTRAEGCTLTNLMATNGTRVNGQRIQSHQLHDGDIVRLGQVSFVFKDQAVSIRDQRLLPRARLALIAGCALLALGLFLLLD
jgi:pSer/pThr/pTyr-binding forkhead associated (FHA) protein